MDKSRGTYKMLKRIEDPYAIEYRLNDILHKTNGPAIQWKETNWYTWWLNGIWHRYYGPQDQNGFWRIHGRTIKK